MRIKEHTDFMRFLKAVRECSQDVLFQTDEGDRLNLKSALSQYVFAMIFSKPELLCAGKIWCAREDFPKLSEFLDA